MAEENFDLSAMLAQAMKDPAVSELAKKLQMNSANSTSQEKESGNGTPLPASLPPEIMEKLPELAGMFGQMGGGVSASNGDIDRRNKLLSALRPYVNDGRRDMIDKIMSLSRITTVLDLMPKK